MQSDVKMANLSENIESNAVTTLLLCFLDNIVPECTEVMLQPRKSIPYVNLGKCLQTVQMEIGAKDLASKIN
jgi:hypothetical protein